MYRHILIAPDKFKGSLSAQAVTEAVRSGIHRFDASIQVYGLPLADGGEGSLELLADLLDLRAVTIPTTDALGRPIEAVYFRQGSVAYVELASAAGLQQLEPHLRNPAVTTTLGTGQLIAHAIQAGAQDIYLFLGGSATHDVGAGIAQALGFQFLDERGETVFPCGANLGRITQIVAPDPSPVSYRLHCLCDVTNPLLGPSGAAAIYATQKGANPALINALEDKTGHFAQLIYQQFDRDIRYLVGGGAAGGIAAGLSGLCGATIASGIEAILDWTGFDQLLRQVDLVISGEGKLDQQTLAGKVIQGVLTRAGTLSKPVLLLVGQNRLPDLPLTPPLIGVRSVLSLAQDESDAMARAGALLNELVYDFLRSNE